MTLKDKSKLGEHLNKSGRINSIPAFEEMTK